MLLGTVLFAADEGAKSSARERLKARIAEDAKKADAKKPAAPPTAPTAPAAGVATTGPAKTAPTPPGPKASTSKAKDGVAKSPAEPPTVLPKVEVKKGRITELDQQIAKQEKDIEREKKNLAASEVDLALNDSKIARPLAIFGGESTQFRQRVASERVELMEAEKDLLEAIARAKTKDEKAKLQKQLDEVRAFRRELDKTLR